MSVVSIEPDDADQPRGAAFVADALQALIGRAVLEALPSRAEVELERHYPARLTKAPANLVRSDAREIFGARPPKVGFAPATTS